jgi:hypothetical protein
MSKLPELTFEEFGSMPIQHTMGMSFDWGSHRMYRNEDLGIQKEVVTMRKEKGNIYGGWHDGDVKYFLDGNPCQFDTSDQLYLAYMEKACGIKP